MITIKQQVPPPFGWEFQEGDIKISASSYADLVKNVLKWRLQARRPVHTVQADVNAYIAKVSPTSILIRKEKKLRKERTFSDKIYNFACKVYNQFSPDLISITPHVANLRAQICASCPYNKNYSSSCPACRAETKRLLQGVRNGRATQFDSSLKGCELLGYDLPTAVWLENTQLDFETYENKKLPNYCWRIPNNLGEN